MTAQSGLSRRVITGIGTIAAAHQWRLELIPPSRIQGELEFFDADAVIIGSSSLGWAIDRFCKRKPTVAVLADFTSRKIPSFDVDDRHVGATAAKHLIDRGLRSLAVFGNRDDDFFDKRCAGFMAFAADHGLEVPSWWFTGNETFRDPDGNREWWLWLKSLPKPVGILAGCDEWGRSLTVACRAAGLRVPEDVAIIGVDNDDLACSLSFPPLSSVEVPWARIGEMAAVAIGDLLEKKRVPPALTLVKPVGVVSRRSTDLLAVDDENVKAALAFIRANADRPIRIADILKKVPVYRQRLHTDFHRVVGRTVMQEVRRVHVDQARRLLETTDLSMPEVARRSGFADYRKMGIWFRKEMGTTPSVYQRQVRVGFPQAK
jgi:LacI family transcriptional regulator